MNQKIIDYLQKNAQVNEVIIERIANSFNNHPDIRNELEIWIDTNEYTKNNPIEVNGYTAEKLADSAPHLKGLSAYGFLVLMRDNPELANEIIEDGFPLH